AGRSHTSARLSPDTPKAGGEVFVVSKWRPILERHEHHLVSGWLRSVPGALQRYEEAAFVLCRKLVALIEDQVQHRRVCPEHAVGWTGGYALAWRHVGKARLRMLADIGERPTVETALLKVKQVVPGQ